MSSSIIFFVVMGVVVICGISLCICASIGHRRAQRNLARYGPRPAIAGRPGQTRTKGLALAVLESLPIVKFGSNSKHLDSISKDIELEEREISSEKSATNVAVVPLDDLDGSSAEHKSSESVTKPASAIDPSPNAVAQINANEKECSICISDFVDSEEVRVLPCNHRFHPKCIDPWLLSISGTCPICRHDLRPEDPNDLQTSEPPPTESFQRGLRSPIGYVRDQALRDREAYNRALESPSPDPDTLTVPSPTLSHPRDRASIRTRLREIRQAHTGQEYVAVLDRLHNYREHRRPSTDNRSSESSPTPAEVVPADVRPSG